MADNLFAAIQDGDLQTTRELLQEDIDINARYDSNCERTLLHYACSYGRLEIVKYLIQEKNANVNSVDCDGWTPLILTCYVTTNHAKEEWAKVVEFLLANGADVNIKTSRKGTALHEACSWCGSTALIQLLLSHGANINSADNDGETPLHYACSYDPQIDVIKFLLANNADRHTKNYLGRGPIDALQLCGFEEVFESYDKWPLTVHKVHATATPTKKVFAGVMVGLNPCLSQHQHTLAVKTILLVRQLPVHEVAFEILGFLTPAAVEKIFLPTV